MKCWQIHRGLRLTIAYFESVLTEGLIKVIAPVRSRILRVGDR
jgi:hypothetical protein